MTRWWSTYPHVRVYSSVFDVIGEDDRALAWYVRLLFQAHAAYPSAAYLPRVPRKVLATLSDAGLIAVSGTRFTMSGVAKERAEVADLAHSAGGTVRAATADRDESGRFVASPAPPAPLDTAGPAISHVFAREDDVLQTDDGRDDVEAFVEVRRRAPTPAQRRVLDDILASHDVTGPKWAADIIRSNPHDPIGAVIAAQMAWRNERKTVAIAEERQSAERNRRPRGLTGVNAEIAKAMAERYAEPEAVA
jgi:hypothetical protein